MRSTIALFALLSISSSAFANECRITSFNGTPLGTVKENVIKGNDGTVVGTSGRILVKTSRGELAGFVEDAQALNRFNEVETITKAADSKGVLRIEVRENKAFGEDGTAIIRGSEHCSTRDIGAASLLLLKFK